MIKYPKTVTYFVVAFLAACQDNITPDPTTRQNEEPKANAVKTNYVIPPEEALGNLQDFLESEKSETRGIPVKKVSAIYPVRVASRHTRSMETSESTDNLLYVANFEDCSGYAILAADYRISDKVIAVTESGYLSESVMAAATSSASQDRPIINHYPADGPGFFTDPRYGDEVFINPNTIDFYIEEKHDTLVGNYDYDPEESYNTVNQNSSDISGNSFIEEYSSALCINYALNEINGDNSNGDEPGGERQPIDEEEVDPDYPDDPDNPWTGTSSGTTIKTTISDWHNVMFKSSILADYKNWWQSSPFNDLCPQRRKYIFIGHKHKAPAGCFPLAIAKILTHFSKPMVFSFNGVSVNWNGLKSKDLYSVDKTSAATLLRGIGNACDSWYFYEGTFTFPFEVTAFLKRIGYSNASDKSYSFERITSMIDNDKPLIIYGLPGIDITSSHSWNIDGYKVKERTITTNVYRDGTLISSTEKTESIKMVHCDFGWSGDCNGYYVTGVFKLNDPNKEIDPGSDKDKKTNYNLIRIITYDKP